LEFGPSPLFDLASIRRARGGVLLRVTRATPLQLEEGRVLGVPGGPLGEVLLLLLDLFDGRHAPVFHLPGDDEILEELAGPGIVLLQEGPAECLTLDLGIDRVVGVGIVAEVPVPGDGVEVVLEDMEELVDVEQDLIVADPAGRRLAGRPRPGTAMLTTVTGVLRRTEQDGPPPRTSVGAAQAFRPAVECWWVTNIPRRAGNPGLRWPTSIRTLFSIEQMRPCPSRSARPDLVGDLAEDVVSSDSGQALS
jgi:hypothetical protein